MTACMILPGGPGFADNGSVTDMTEAELAAELIAEAKAAKRSKAAYERHSARVRELLVAVRSTDVKKYGPPKLEKMISELYDRAYISRLTARAVGVNRKPAPGEQLQDCA
jgi:hypothetical protein